MGNFNGNVSGTVIEETMVSSNTYERKNDFDVKNYLNTKLANGENERTLTVRILPVSNEDGNFRIAVKTHNLKVSKRIAKSGFKSFLCLNDPQVPDYSSSVKCPLCEKAREYFNEGKAIVKSTPDDEVRVKTLYKKGGSLLPKTTYIVRVIERGKEDEGVKFWRFNENTQGKGIYDALIALYKQRKADMEEAGIENYNIFDLDNGRDIVINLKRTTRADGKDGVAVQITDKSVNKPLTTDVNLGNSWINDAKRWYQAYTVKSPEYLAIIAEDKIPYYDRSIGGFVGKTEADFQAYENGGSESKSEDVQQSAVSNAQTELPKFSENVQSDDFDLPF